jgi:hypothetical protein
VPSKEGQEGKEAAVATPAEPAAIRARLEADEANLAKEKRWPYTYRYGQWKANYKPQGRADVATLLGWLDDLQVWVSAEMERAQEQLEAWKDSPMCQCTMPGDAYDDCHVHGGGDRQLYDDYPTAPYSLRAELETSQAALEASQAEVKRLKRESG